MDQLDYFREQLNKKPSEASPVPQEEVKKKRSRKSTQSETAKGLVNLKITAECHRKVRLLSVWLDANGIRHRMQLNDLLEEALDLMIESKYPKFKAALKGFQAKE